LPPKKNPHHFFTPTRTGKKVLFLNLIKKLIKKKGKGSGKEKIFWGGGGGGPGPRKKKPKKNGGGFGAQTYFWAVGGGGGGGGGGGAGGEKNHFAIPPMDPFFAGRQGNAAPLPGGGSQKGGVGGPRGIRRPLQNQGSGSTGAFSDFLQGGGIGKRGRDHLFFSSRMAALDCYDGGDDKFLLLAGGS